ncbi:acetamidase/formamidase family protein [Blastococcus sp. PRF04-17]|uniref:acetamidase/formamidase family protein n=1 Tax=Blastococcus sp. PRF04-17 TaxID=2933797 RepID=UPI001FF5E957|nr:acetamidase/formamidase family protein [Blastococcus sp. PRF04-17]UOY00316.1 acetamidase/formamidase family protein [Blastococcus sp. PRF04-17]
MDVVQELHGWFDRDLPPVRTVEPGTTVRFRTLDSGWFLEPDTGGDVADRRRAPEHTPDAGHALAGPVEVRGARAGQVLAVRIDDVVPVSWGTTYAGLRATAWNSRLGLTEPAVHRWTIDGATARNQFGHEVTVRPFLGVIGMPPADPGRHSTVPPRWHGGNLDCRELVAGSTLYLPIPVDGALLSVGDAHAAQGDGEVSGTAIECGTERADLSLDVRDGLFGRPLATPVADTPAGWICLGIGDDLDEAAAEALDAMLDLLGALHGASRSDAMALASVAVDLRVTQVANQVFGVHAVLPHGAVRS